MVLKQTQRQSLRIWATQYIQYIVCSQHSTRFFYIAKWGQHSLEKNPFQLINCLLHLQACMMLLKYLQPRVNMTGVASVLPPLKRAVQERTFSFSLFNCLRQWVQYKTVTIPKCSVARTPRGRTSFFIEADSVLYIPL